MSNIPRYLGVGTPTTRLKKTIKKLQRAIDYLCDQVDQLKQEDHSVIVKETFGNLSSGNSVTLSNNPIDVLVVIRNDAISNGEGTIRYEVSGNNVNFFPNFGEIEENETVEIIYTY